jgi:hypothetical protein
MCPPSETFEDNLRLGIARLQPTSEDKERGMAQLTTLEAKLGEVLGLAMAAQGAGEKVSGLVDDSDLTQTLDSMVKEAKETEERCTQVADGLDGKKTAILEQARETKKEATEMMSTYLGADADGLDGFEFLTMAEAGEVGHWGVLGVLGEKAGNAEVQELVEWATPIQQRHFELVLNGSLQLAGDENPNAEE